MAIKLEKDASLQGRRFMSIFLQCPCGRSLQLSAERAGTVVTCSACGTSVRVPAMGRLEQPVPGPHAPPRRSGNRRAWAALAAGILLLSFGGFYLATRSTPAQKEPAAVATSSDPERLKTATAPENRAQQPAPEERVGPEELPLPQVVVPSTPTAKESAQPEKKPTPPTQVPQKTPQSPRHRFLAGDRFFQEIIVTQKPTFALQGIPVVTLLRYRLLSSFVADKVQADGRTRFLQKVEEAALLEADAATRALLAPSVATLPGTKFTLVATAAGDIESFEGADGKAQPGGGPVLGGQGLQMASLLDRDGWKEMAHVTLLKPALLQPGARWSRAFEHQWGELGSWHGQKHFVHVGAKGPVQQINYVLQVSHRAPAAAKKGTLLQINSASFQTQQAAGMILYDAVRDRVVSAEETFQVRGNLVLNLLGQNTPVAVSENQHFQVRVLDAWTGKER